MSWRYNLYQPILEPTTNGASTSNKRIEIHVEKY